MVVAFIDSTSAHAARRAKAFRLLRAALDERRIVQASLRSGGGMLTVGPHTPAVGERGLFSVNWYFADGKQDSFEDLAEPEAARIFIQTCGSKNVLAALECE